jgi:purine-nucleoside phosphorylase
MNINDAAAFLSGPERPLAGIVLGSGLGSLTEQITEKRYLDYKEIDAFPQSTVEGHSGQFVSGLLNGVPLVVARGRFHYYEGYTLEQVLSLVNFFHQMGVRELIISNAAGLINTQHQVGDIFGISDCLDFTGQAEAAGDVKRCVISESEGEMMREAAKFLSKALPFGKYVWTTGPSYETPAEIRYFKSLGGDLVGMSTMPEIIRARELGMRVYPFSVATNYASGISISALNHDEVKETAEAIKAEFAALVSRLAALIKEKRVNG